jgi:holin-like protein
MKIKPGSNNGKSEWDLTAKNTHLLHDERVRIFSCIIVSYLLRERLQVVKAVMVVVQIGILYVLYIIGEWIADIFNLLIPGSVIGMILLLGLLFLRGMKVEWVEDGAGFMVRHLTFFFIPATVGIMQYYDVFAGKGFLLVVIVLFSTMFVMVVSGLTGQLLWQRKDRKQ